MKKFFTKVILAAVFLAAAGVKAHASGEVAYSGTFVGTEGLAATTGNAQAKTYTRDYNTSGDRISLQVTYSTYTVAISTNFGSGQYTLNQPTVTIAGVSTGWVTGLEVLYSSAGANVISGLTDQTSYYLSVISGGGTGGSSTTNPVVFKLSTTLANAVAGTGIVLASSGAVTNRFTLAPLAWTNTSGGGIQFQVSDDNSNFINMTTGNYGLAISSVTFALAGASTIYDLGLVNHRYLRIKESPATTGATVYTIKANEKWPVQN